MPMRLAKKIANACNQTISCKNLFEGLGMVNITKGNTNKGNLVLKSLMA